MVYYYYRFSLGTMSKTHTRSIYLFTYSRALNLGIDIRSGLNQSIEINIILSFTPSWQVHSQDFKLYNVHLWDPAETVSPFTSSQFYFGLVIVYL